MTLEELNSAYDFDFIVPIKVHRSVCRIRSGLNILSGVNSFELAKIMSEIAS